MRWKNVLRSLLFPPPLCTAFLCVLSLAGLLYSFVLAEAIDVLSIVSYTLSFYTLVILCLRAPNIVRFVKRFCQENPYYGLVKNDIQLRMNMSLLFSLIWNAGYALWQIGLGLYHHSVWYYAMSLYYLLLAAMRTLLGQHIRINVPGVKRREEWRRYRWCGVGLLMMNLMLLVFIFYYVNELRVVRHHEITTIAMATYTFVALVMAARNVVRYRRYESPVCSAAKAISLATAAVSMLSLENSMLSTFSKTESTHFRMVMVSISGLLVVLLILCMAIWMIWNATRNLKNEEIRRVSL